MLLVVQPFIQSDQQVLQNLITLYYSGLYGPQQVLLSKISESCVLEMPKVTPDFINFYKDQRRFNMENALHNICVEFAFICHKSQ